MAEPAQKIEVKESILSINNIEVVFDNVHVLDKAATFHDLENPLAHNFIRVTVADRFTFKMDRALGHLAILSLKQSRNSFESR